MFVLVVTTPLEKFSRHVMIHTAKLASDLAPIHHFPNSNIGCLARCSNHVPSAVIIKVGNELSKSFASGFR